MAASSHAEQQGEVPESPRRRAAGAVVLVGLGFVVLPQNQHSEATRTCPIFVEIFDVLELLSACFALFWVPLLVAVA